MLEPEEPVFSREELIEHFATLEARKKRNARGRTVVECAVCFQPALTEEAGDYPSMDLWFHGECEREFHAQLTQLERALGEELG